MLMFCLYTMRGGHSGWTKTWRPFLIVAGTVYMHILKKVIFVSAKVHVHVRTTTQVSKRTPFMDMLTNKVPALQLWRKIAVVM